jgi:hypothetical protein
MDAMTAYGGDDLMNVAMAIAYATRRDAFEGSGASGGVAYAFDVADVPVVRLVPGEPGRNVAIDLKRVRIEVRGGVINVARTLALQATGTLALREGELSLTGLRVATSAKGVLDRVAVGLIDSRIVPRIAAALAAVPIPQLTHVFGHELAAALERVEVIDGPALRAGASIVGRPDVAAADPPSPADVDALNGEGGGGALLIAMVSGGALNVLMQALVPPIAHAFDRRGGASRFGAGIRGVIRATTPVLDVREGRGTATTTVSFDGLQGGIRLPVKGWTWVRLPSPATEVAIAHTLSATGDRGLITLTSVERIGVSLSWPRVLAPVETIVRGLLNGTLSRFRGQIDEAVSGRAFALFELPATVPGTGMAADVSFASDGLSYHEGSVRALVRVRLRGLEGARASIVGSSA